MNINKSIVEFIQLEAQSLDVGYTKRVVCPACNDTKEKTCSITREKSTILYNCFRASCTFHGSIDVATGRNNTYTVPNRIPLGNSFKGELVTLPTAYKVLLRNQYGLTKRQMEDFKLARQEGYDCDRLYMPLYDFDGKCLGGVAKRLVVNKLKVPKVRNYFFDYTVKYHAPRTRTYRQQEPFVIVVEDVLSATKVSAVAPCVALLGTFLQKETVELLAYRTRNLILYLDDDTWELSETRDVPVGMSLKRKYGWYFDSIKFMRTIKDPKETDLKEIRELLQEVVSDGTEDN